MNITLTQTEIDEAIRKAREAREIEGEILDFADQHEGPVAGGLDHRHMAAFVEGMAPHLGVTVRRRAGEDRLLEIELPEILVGRFPEFGKRRLVSLTLDPAVARRRRDVFPLDFRLGFIAELARHARARRFDGLCSAAPSAADLGFGWLTLWRVRWQDVDGQLLEEGQIPMILNPAGAWRRWPDELFAALLLEPIPSSTTRPTCDPGSIKALDQAISAVIARDVSARRHPAARFLAAALGTTSQ